MKTQPTTVVILILLATLIVGLGIYRMCLFITGNDTGNPSECPQRRVYLNAFERVGFRCARSAD